MVICSSSLYLRFLHILQMSSFIAEIDTIDDIKDVTQWVRCNRQKFVLEADFREALYLQEEGRPHSTELFVKELTTICGK